MDLIQKYLDIAKKGKESEECNTQHEEETSGDDYIPTVLRTFPGSRVVSGKEVKWIQ